MLHPTKSDESKNLEIMSRTYNYNKWIYDNIKKFSGERILEIGSGLGSITHFFIKKKLLVGTETSLTNLDYLKRKFRRFNNFKFFDYDISECHNLLVQYKFDTVLCVNVLEHIKNDKKAIENMNKVLIKGGKLILIVPAFSCLYGSIDRSDKHYRRYNKKSLVNDLKNGGFKVVHCKYMNFPGFFGWYFHSKILNLKVHQKDDLSLFNKLVPIFKFLELIISPPFGLSLICVCEK